MLQIQLSNMLLSSNSNRKNRKNNDNIFDSVQKTMFTNDNINRWTRFLQEPSNTTIVKSKKKFPNKQKGKRKKRKKNKQKNRREATT